MSCSSVGRFIIATQASTVSTLSTMYDSSLTPTLSTSNTQDSCPITERYLCVKENILNDDTKNKGEKGEILAKLELFHLDSLNERHKLVEILGTDASEGISFLDMDTDDEIVDITKLTEKASSYWKADCKIKMRKTGKIYCASIKTKEIPALLNHTPRSGKVFQEGGTLHDYIEDLDKIAEEYIDKRNAGKSQDMNIDEFECLKDQLLKERFMDVLAYFVFDGTGRGDSKCKANAMITRYKNGKITFTKCDNINEKRSYIVSIYNRLNISFRNKGMPKCISDDCKAWIFNDNNTPKGSLHVRVK